MQINKRQKKLMTFFTYFCKKKKEEYRGNYIFSE